MQLTAEQRIKACMLIEQMKKMPEYCEKIGLMDISEPTDGLKASSRKNPTNRGIGE